MAQKRVQLDRETFSCSICLDLLKDPVTIPCGHSYCMNCVTRFWDEGEKKTNSCPQCRQTFTPRPVLVKNTMLADVVEQLKKTGLQAAPADHCYAGPEDVACDFCTGRKLKAFKSCLMCLVSYCETHVQPHYNSPAFQKHKLVEPSKKLQENICSRHHRVKELFCRTDQQCICYLCSVDEHKGHDTISAAAERTERQRALEGSRQRIQQKIRSHHKTEASRVKKLQQKLEQEITELKRKNAELKQLSHTEDYNQFLLNYPSLSELNDPIISSSINIRPLTYFEDVTAAVSELRDKLQAILRETRTNVSLTVSEVDVLLSEPEPKTRTGFLKYSREITLNPNTANKHLLLSERNRKVMVTNQQQPYSHHQDRFTAWWQVLSRESLTGRCYWEVKWSRGVFIAVAYKNINRAGRGIECGFGHNDKSWALVCSNNMYEYLHKNMSTPVSGPESSRIGVYLDHRAGFLSFYSVSETMTLLHRVQTTFTQPLYAGLYVYYFNSTAEICKAK